MLKDKQKSKQGTTLIEVLISLVILAVVLGGNAALFVKCDIFASALKEQTVVSNALNERMEEIRNMSYPAISTSLVPSFSASGFSELNNPVGSMAPLPNPCPFDGTNCQKIVLTVDWDSRRGLPLSKSLAAYITRDGINRQ